MPPYPPRIVPLQAAAFSLVTLLVSVAVAPAAVPAGPAALDRAAADDEASLAAARDRSARAEASIDSLKGALSPGHLTDAALDADRPFGLEALRLAYADVQRQAAGYRATLGEHHPALVAAEQALADLRSQLLDGTRKALAAAERDAREARAAVGTLERRLATRGASASAPIDRGDMTGSVKVPSQPRIPTALSVDAGVEPLAAPAAPRRTPVPSQTLAGTLLGLAAAVLAALIAVWVGLRLFAARRRAGPSEPRRVEPALSRSAPSSTPPLAAAAASEPSLRPPVPDDTVPVLATLPAAIDADMDLAAAGDLHATLRAAFPGGPEARMTVLVAPAGGLSEAEVDGAALALALAAAGAGRRPLLMEARAVGRLRRERVASAATPLLIEAGGMVRTLYRIGAEGPIVAVLPSDPGEAEAAAEAAARPDATRLHGFSAFDTVIIVGDDAEALATGADLLLLAAPAGTEAEALTLAARPLRAAGRPCGVLLVARIAAVSPTSRPAPRRRILPDGGQTARIGLRGTFDPGRRRVGG